MSIAQFIIDAITLIPNIFDENITNNDPLQIVSIFNKYWNIHQSAPNKWGGRIAWNFKSTHNTLNELLFIHRHGIISKNIYKYYKPDRNMNDIFDHISTLKLRMNVSLSFEGAADFFSISFRSKNDFNNSGYGGVRSLCSTHICQGWGPSRIEIRQKQRHEKECGLPYAPRRGQILNCTLTDTLNYKQGDRNTMNVNLTADDKRMKAQTDIVYDKQRQEIEKEYGYIVLFNREQPGCITSVSFLSLCLDINQT